MAGMGETRSKDEIKVIRHFQSMLLGFANVVSKDIIEDTIALWTSKLRPKIEYEETDLNQIKDGFDLLGYASEFVTLKKRGTSFVGLCPFHNEKTPSFHVHPDKQRFKCFGCGKSGSIFDFVMNLQNIDFSEALKFLCQQRPAS
jgi:hypothetical protein